MSTTDPNSPSDPSTPASALAEGTKLAGCYALTRRLAVSDGTEVWLAHDEVLGKDVSLHFLPAAVRKDARALQELRVDIKRNRQLIHPNILRVYDLVEEPDWVAISMETFEAESLAHRLALQNGQGMKAAEIQPWAEQLAHTLEEAHKINVLHRDLAPANLFLTSSGKLLVANFGISRTVREARARAGEADASASAYESPQLLDGQAPARTDDVYSLGAVLYAALTGKPPFTGKDITQQVRAGLPPAALETLRNKSADLPPAWVAAIAACLDKNAETRPQSASEFSRRLAGGAAQAPVAAAQVKSAVSEPVPQPAPAVVAPARPPVEQPAPKPAERAPKEARAPKEEREELEISRPAAPAQKSRERVLSKEFVPRLYPEESRFPVKALAAAAVLVAVIIIWASSKKSAEPSRDQQPVNAEVSTPADATPPVAANATPGPTVEAPTSIPGTPVVSAPKARTPSPAPAALSAADKALAERTAALEKARTTAQAAEKMHADWLKQQTAADASVAETQKAIEEKARAAEPLKKAAQEAPMLRKKLEDEQKAAEAAAAEAQRIAAEKALLAEEGKRALVEMDKKNLEKAAAQQQADAEIAALQKTLAEKLRIADDTAKAASEAQSAKQQQLAIAAEHEREIERAKAADMEAQRQREAAEAERSKLDQELAEMKRAFDERMRDLENKRKALENPGAAPAVKPPPVSPATPKAVPPSASITPIPVRRATTPEPIKMASIPATPAPLLTAIPAPALAGPGTNSLGMKFVPVGDVEFCVWQTRIKDFEVFAKAVSFKSTSWKGPGFKQGPDHPVVNVSWQEAVAFCKWLTDKEHKENVLAAQQFYRLPTDLEWSKAVGLPDEPGKTPEARDMAVQDVYPWGTQWPPPPGAGNYTGEETGSDVAIKGYDDGFAWTSPVGSFPPNKLGIYDMGGNVWQWCMDSWNAESKAKVLRGASWYNGALKLSLLSSCRVHAAPDSSTDNYGFRIVRASEVPKTGKK